MPLVSLLGNLTTDADARHGLLLLVHWVAATGLTYGVDATFRGAIDTHYTEDFVPYGQFLHGLLDVTLDDFEAFGRRVKVVDTAAGPYGHGSLDAWRAWHEGRPDDAVALLTDHAPRRHDGKPILGVGTPERLLYAMALHESGDLDASVRWLSTFGSHTGYDISHIPSADLRHAQVSQQVGAVQEAGDHYRRFVKLWEGGDPEIQPRVEAARR